MKELIYSKKYPKQKQDRYIKEDFYECINRKTENELWTELFEAKCDKRVLFRDDLHVLREKHMRACVDFAEENEIDVEIFKGTEDTCINLSFDGFLNISEIKESLSFADRIILASGTGDKDITLSLTFQTHKIVLFKKKHQD